MAVLFRIKEAMGRWELAQRRRLSVEELSQETGVSVQTLSRMADPSLDYSTSTATIERLCRFFGEGPEVLMAFHPPLGVANEGAAAAGASQRRSPSPVAEVLRRYLDQRHDGWWEEWLVEVAQRVYHAPSARPGDRVVVRAKGVTVKGTGSPTWNVAIAAAGDRLRVSENPSGQFAHSRYDNPTELERLSGLVERLLDEERQAASRAAAGEKLVDCFTSAKAPECLDAYARFAAERNWEVGHKVRLYEASAEAFGDSDASDEDRLRAFGRIYGELRSNWQVFRHAESYWPVEKAHEVLAGPCAACGREAGLHLLRELGDEDIATIKGCVRQLTELKVLRSREDPVMAASKFLHFFNPELFPIYDRSVIGGRVLHTFRREFTEFCAREGRAMPRDGFGQYVEYLLWASDIMRSSRGDAMPAFEQWFAKHCASDTSENVTVGAGSYYATAFEFISIGAEVLARDQRA